MPKKVSNIKDYKPMTDSDVSPEVKKLYDNRIYRFTEILGDEWSKKEVELLAKSKVDYWELQDLVSNGCPPKLAVKILI